MKIKRERKEKWKFVIFPRRCSDCMEMVFLEKMFMIKVPWRYHTDLDYYCKECLQDGSGHKKSWGMLV